MNFDYPNCPYGNTAQKTKLPYRGMSLSGKAHPQVELRKVKGGDGKWWMLTTLVRRGAVWATYHDEAEARAQANREAARRQCEVVEVHE